MAYKMFNKKDCDCFSMFVPKCKGMFKKYCKSGTLLFLVLFALVLFSFSIEAGWNHSNENGFSKEKKGRGAPLDAMLVKGYLKKSNGSSSVDKNNPADRADMMDVTKELCGRLKGHFKSAGRRGRSPWVQGGVLVKRRGGSPVFIKEKPYDLSGIREVSGRFKARSVSDVFVLKRANEWLGANREMLELNNPLVDLRFEKMWQDRLGKWHIKYVQLIKGIFVFGTELILHYEPVTDAFCVTGTYFPNKGISLGDTMASLSENEAIERLMVYRRGLTVSEIKESACVYFYDQEPVPRLSWHIHAVSRFSFNSDIFIDAKTGNVISEISRIRNTTGPAVGNGYDLNGTLRELNTYQIENNYYDAYFLIDTSKNMFNELIQVERPADIEGGIFCLDYHALNNTIKYFSSADNNWSDSYAVSTMFNASEIYDYFENTYGLKSFDGNGKNIYIVIHYTSNEDTKGFVAAWDGKYILIGDEYEGELSDIPAALDIIAHEYGHAVVENKANFIYKGQPGTLDEAFADFFAVMVDRDDWTIGEDVTIAPYRALRDFENPDSLDLIEKGVYHIDDYEPLPFTVDNGGVHRYVGIINRATFLIAEQLGRSTTEDIYYKALDDYLTRYSGFYDLRIALEQSARDIFADSNNAVKIINESFDKVGITETIQGMDFDETEFTPVITGEEWILYLDPNNLSLWRIKSDGSQNQMITDTQVYSRPIAFKDGYIWFIDTDMNLRSIYIDGSDEEVLIEEGMFNSIAVTPDYESVAITFSIDEGDPASIENANKILLMTYNNDTDNYDDRTIEIVPPTTVHQGEIQFSLCLPDQMDFSYNGKYLIFDALNYIIYTEADTIEDQNQSEETISYWDISRLHIPTLTIDRPLPILESGFEVFNPVFLKGYSTKFIYELHSIIDESYKTIINRIKEDDESILLNQNSIGWPAISPDNNHFIFQTEMDGKSYLKIMDLSVFFNVVQDSDRFLMSNGKKVEGELATWIKQESVSDTDFYGSYRGFFNIHNEGTSCFISYAGKK